MVKKTQTKKKTSEIKAADNNNTDIESAKLLLDITREDYAQQVAAYDKVYDKINIATAFCGVILVVVLSSVDFSMFDSFCKGDIKGIVHVICSTISALATISSIIILLLLLKSKPLRIIDSIGMRNAKYYSKTYNDCLLSMIDDYNHAIYSFRESISEKQKKYNIAIILLLVAVISFTIEALT